MRILDDIPDIASVSRLDLNEDVSVLATEHFFNGLISKRTPWRTFLKAHWETLAAADFFTVEVARPFGLVTYYILFVMELSTRRVEIAGITSNPDGASMMPVARNLTDAFDGFLLGKRYLILDRDSKYTNQFRRLLVESASAGSSSTTIARLRSGNRSRGRSERHGGSRPAQAGMAGGFSDCRETFRS